MLLWFHPLASMVSKGKVKKKFGNSQPYPCSLRSARVFLGRSAPAIQRQSDFLPSPLKLSRISALACFLEKEAKIGRLPVRRSEPRRVPRGTYKEKTLPSLCPSVLYIVLGSRGGSVAGLLPWSQSVGDLVPLAWTLSLSCAMGFPP